jgi:CBS-domain-containing membrane protein
MARANLPGPQSTLLFRIVAFVSRLRLRYLVQTSVRASLLAPVFVFLAGTTALGIITLAAYVTKLPLLFPPLGPSAFILFHAPLSATASPRSVVLSHTLAVASGLLALRLVGLARPAILTGGGDVLDLWHVAAIALAMGLVSVAMVATRCAHPPAAATALIAALGYLDDAVCVAGLLAAVVLLVLDAILINRVLGGLPYPLWRPDPRGSRGFGELAGVPDSAATYWQQLSTRIFRRR